MSWDAPYPEWPLKKPQNPQPMAFEDNTSGDSFQQQTAPEYDVRAPLSEFPVGAPAPIEQLTPNVPEYDVRAPLSEFPVDAPPQQASQQPIVPDEPIRAPLSEMPAQAPIQETDNQDGGGLPTVASQPAKSNSIDALSKQILGQGLTDQWTGSGYGSAEANARDMARIMDSIGITDIKQFGRFTQKGLPEEVRPDGRGGFVDSKGNAVDPSLVTTETQSGESGEWTTHTAPVGTQEVYGNKETGQAVPITYSERQTGNAWGGTYEGSGNTGYRVQFDAQGNPYFFTTGASSNNIATLMKDLGPIGQIGLAVATGGLSIPEQIAANMALQVASGVKLKDAIKGAAVSYAGAQIPGLSAIKEGTSFLNGFDTTGTLGKAFQNAAVSGAKAVLSGKDVGDAMKLGAVTGGVSGATNALLNNVEGFQDLTKSQQRMVTNAVSGIISGKPLEQIVIDSAIAAANASVANAKNPSASKSIDKPIDAAEDYENKEIDRLTKLGYTNKQISEYLDNLNNLTSNLDEPIKTIAPIDDENASPLTTLNQAQQTPVQQNPDDTVDISSKSGLPPATPVEPVEPVEPIAPVTAPLSQTRSLQIPNQQINAGELVVGEKKKEEEKPTEPVEPIPPLSLPVEQPVKSITIPNKVEAGELVVKDTRKKDEEEPSEPLEFPVEAGNANTSLSPNLVITAKGNKKVVDETPSEPLVFPVEGNNSNTSTQPHLTIVDKKYPTVEETNVEKPAGALPTTTNPISSATPTTGGTGTTGTTTASRTSGSGLGSITSKPLDSSAQFLKAAPVSKKKAGELMALQQLFSSLTPEMQSVFADRGITPPVTEPDSDLPKEMGEEQPTTFAASGGLISSDTQKILDSLQPNYVKAQTHLAAAPVIDQATRLQILKHLAEGPLKGAGMRGGLAHGGLPTKYEKAAPEGHNPEFITGLTGYYAQGGGTGQSDDIPAMLHDGDYVMDADTVAALGDGSSKAGAEVLEKMRNSIPQSKSHGGGTPVAAKIADGEYVFPASFVTAIGGGSNALGAKRLNEMREKIRAHKRSAPTTKIPPKAKSPLDYLKMAKG